MALSPILKHLLTKSQVTAKCLELGTDCSLFNEMTSFLQLFFTHCHCLGLDEREYKVQQLYNET